MFWSLGVAVAISCVVPSSSISCGSDFLNNRCFYFLNSICWAKDKQSLIFILTFVCLKSFNFGQLVYQIYQQLLLDLQVLYFFVIPVGEFSAWSLVSYWTKSSSVFILLTSTVCCAHVFSDPIFWKLPVANFEISHLIFCNLLHALINYVGELPPWNIKQVLYINSEITIYYFEP